MIICRIKGTVTNNTEDINIPGAKFLLAEKCNTDGSPKGEFVVAIDLVGAGSGELVMVSEGSACRETPETKNKPLDAAVVGIIDLIDEEEKTVYRK